MKTPPWSDESTAANGRSVQFNFGRWFDGSVLVDGEGLPLTLYRGQRRTPRDDGFTTTQGRATPSFTHDPHVASVYSRQLSTWDYGAGSTVVPVFIAMRKPLDLRSWGEQMTLDDLMMAVDGMNLAEETVEGGIGYLDLAEAIRGFDTVAYKTNARFDIDGDDGKGRRLRSFEEVSDRIYELGSEGHDEELSNLLCEVRFDTYMLADSKNFTRLLKGLGYDGVIHKDVFDVGAKHYQGPEAPEEGFDAQAVIVTYRTFEPGQVKSALCNAGLYLRDSASLSDSDAARALVQANAARDLLSASGRQSLACVP